MSERWVTIPPDLVRSGLVYPSQLMADLWSRPLAIFKPIWDSGIDGTGVVISDNDTGVCNGHPDIDYSKIVVNKNYTSDASGVDGNGHGSHTLGTICTKAWGVAPGVTVHVRKVLSNRGSGSTTWINKAVVDAAKDGADFTNESLGSSPGQEQREDLEATEQAYANGLKLRIAAAGNAGYNGANTIGPPGSLPNVWTVGSYDESGKISNFSSGGKTIECACPGSNIQSINYRGGSTVMSGTSMATPFWTGIMALVLHALRRNGHKDPVGYDAWYKFFIDNNLLDDPNEPGFDPRFGFGKPNIVKVIKWLGGPTWL